MIPVLLQICILQKKSLLPILCSLQYVYIGMYSEHHTFITQPIPALLKSMNIEPIPSMVLNSLSRIHKVSSHAGKYILGFRFTDLQNLILSLLRPTFSGN